MNFSTLFANDIKIFFPEIFLTFAILIVLIYGVLVATSLTYNYPLVSRNIYFLVLFILGIGMALVFSNPNESSLIFQKTFIHDDCTRIAKLFVLGSAFVCLVFSQSFLEKSQINNYEYFLLILFSILGLQLLISSHDLLSAYLAIELQALSFYVLAALKRRSVYSTEAGLKYFILGAFSSGLLTYAFSLIYGVTGTTNLCDLRNFCMDSHFDGAPLLKGALLFLVAGFLFKIAAFPFHMWSPDVYEGAPTPTTVFFAVVPKLAILTFFVRLLSFSFSSFAEVWENLILFSACGSIVYASFVAIKQDSFKRLLAYSGIGHVGFLLLPLSGNSLDGLQALFFYALVYMITSLPTWGVVLAGLKGKKDSQNNLTLLSGFPNASPALALIAALSMFSLAGIPPLVGFYSKVFVFFSAIKESLYFVAFLVLAMSVVSTFYYISLVKTLYFEKNKNWIFYEEVSKGMSLFLSLFLFLLLFFFFQPNFLLLCSQKMALAIL